MHFTDKLYHFGGHLKGNERTAFFLSITVSFLFQMEKVACLDNNCRYQPQAVNFNKHNLDHAIFIFLEQNCIVKTMQYLKEK